MQFASPRLSERIDKMDNPAVSPALAATLNAAVMRGVNLAASVKAFAVAKADALAACKAAPETAPEGYAVRVRECVRKTPAYRPEDMEAGNDYAMVLSAKDAPAFAVPTLAVSPWLAYDFFALAESNAKAGKDANAKRLAAALAEAGVDKWQVAGYGTASLCKGKPKAKAGAVPVSVAETPYTVEEMLTPYKREEAKAHAEDGEDA